MPYLTKSRFNIALNCRTQLYYNDNKQYANRASDDSFLKELATGGFQVGALARCYYPEGIMIDSKNHYDSVMQTLDLLVKENVIIFEAAFLYENCFIRTDVLIKKGDELRLIEVKAKSIHPTTNKFFNTKGDVDSKWRPYLYDVTYQSWVVKNALLNAQLAHLKVTPYLMLANKDASTSSEGLNQRFRYNSQTSKLMFDKGLTTPEELGDKILIETDVSKEVQHLLEQNIEGLSFEAFVQQCANAVNTNELLPAVIGGKCKKCGFTADETQMLSGSLNGFHQCWKEHAGFTDADFKKPMAWTIWDSRRKDTWLEEKKYFVDQINIDDLGDDKSDGYGMSRIQRQDIQRIKTINKDYTPHIEIPNLQRYFSEWEYPLNCIDFETTAVALPFHKGMHPYEQIAFQFSHHIIKEDGTVIHQTEWINTTQGHFPNFDFVRALKNALSDGGTIFRYSHHENTVLCQIHKQIQESTEPDKEALSSFIEEITSKKSVDKKTYLWDGRRTMVDLLQVVKECYYSLYAGGSNSIKYILPAILNSSIYLQEIYSKPIYGTDQSVSKNFKEFIWIKRENGLVNNPYNLLEPVFSREEDIMLDDLLMDEECGIYEGGAAMAAYGKMQFTAMSDIERLKVKDALLRYCELDTLAMVMILQEFKSLISSKRGI